MTGKVMPPHERYSAESKFRDQKMRLISGVVGVGLMQEERFPEADRYLKPLMEWPDLPPESECLDPGMTKTDRREVAPDLSREIVSVVTILKRGQTCTKEELDTVSKRLVRTLDELGSGKPK